MPLWNGPTWTCHHCRTVNAEIRKRCRSCGAEWFHPDPQIDAEVQHQTDEARRIDDAIEANMPAGWKLAGPRP